METEAARGKEKREAFLRSIRPNLEEALHYTTRRKVNEMKKRWALVGVRVNYHFSLF